MISTRQVFLMGTGRSGTTIVNRMLGLHKNIWSFRHESQIFSGLPPLVDFIDDPLMPQKFERFEENLLGPLYKRGHEDSYFAGLWEIIEFNKLKALVKQLKNALVVSNTSEERRRACFEFSEGIFSAAASRENKPLWIEKTPRNLLYADQIQKLYPGAKFINVVRDGRMVARSILTKKFWPIAKSARFKESHSLGGDFTETRALQYWVNLMYVTDVMRQKVGSENWLDVRLEDLTTQMPMFQRRVERFLRVSHDTEFIEKCKTIFDSVAASRQVDNQIVNTEEKKLIRNVYHYLTIYGYT